MPLIPFLWMQGILASTTGNLPFDARKFLNDIGIAATPWNGRRAPVHRAFAGTAV